ncbi:MAG TPA: DUF3536 domain-containing protein, partial [Gemmatimonadales bacterium]|nr:DUF3536 domain-containing protein [Gemmatimonadales bacterium]
SRKRHGFGNAIAAPYHHIILPLASRRDKVTEVRWGIRDFQRRFGRDPEGMWLPETAVDEESLDVLAQEGIRFTILAPHQVTTPPLYGLPGMVHTPGNRRIAVFPYDGTVSHDIAFGTLIRDADSWAKRMVMPPDDVGGPKLVSVATDGETYGHHVPFGEMALASMLERLEHAPVLVENHAAFLHRHPPRESVTLAGTTSWSCSHGVGRWRSDCGCRTKPGTSQAWRQPMREALDWLKDALDERFEREGRASVEDPWALRDDWDPNAPISDLPVGARELLELQRNALRMFTSCGWFFDDIAGLEATQCLRYALRATEYAGEEESTLRHGLRERLRPARSNDQIAGDGAAVLETRAAASHPATARAAAGVAALARFAPTLVPTSLGVFDVIRATTELVVVRHRRTGRTTTMQTQVVGDGVTELEVQVDDVDTPVAPVVVQLTQLPEPARDALRQHAQATLLPAVLSLAEREAVAAGVQAYADALRRAMLRHLGQDAAHVNLAALRAALSLLALDRRPVPFDVQTQFYRIYTGADPEAAARLAPLVEDFGFSAVLAGRPSTRG